MLQALDYFICNIKPVNWSAAYLQRFFCSNQSKIINRQLELFFATAYNYLHKGVCFYSFQFINCGMSLYDKVQCLAISHPSENGQDQGGEQIFLECFRIGRSTTLCWEPVSIVSNTRSGSSIKWPT